MDTLHFAIFASKKKTKEGRDFWVFTTKLPKKDGSGEVYVNVKFRDGVQPPKPEDCPMYLDVDRNNASLQTKEEHAKNEVDEDVTYVRRNLWIAAYSISDEKYVDHSLDEF